MCLVSGALALVFPVTVMCCPGFPGCFPESRPWVLSLGAVVFTCIYLILHLLVLLLSILAFNIKKILVILKYNKYHIL